MSDYTPVPETVIGMPMKIQQGKVQTVVVSTMVYGDVVDTVLF